MALKTDHNVYTTPFLINMCREISMFPVSDFDEQ